MFVILWLYVFASLVMHTSAKKETKKNQRKRKSKGRSEGHVLAGKEASKERREQGNAEHSSQNDQQGRFSAASSAIHRQVLLQGATAAARRGA
jgi:hypothetical protein